MDCQLLKIVPQYCLKIILYALLNSKETILKKTKQIICYKILLYYELQQKGKVISDKSDQVII